MENICRHHNKNKLGTGKTYTIMYMNVYDNIYIFFNGCQMVQLQHLPVGDDS